MRRLLVKITAGAEDAERANQALTVAAAAVAVGAEVSLWLTGDATWFAVADRPLDLGLDQATPAENLIQAVLAAGVVTVCTQCAARRGIVAADLRPGAEIAGAASFVEEALADDVQALVY